jgi:hypothetical protein
MCMWSCLFFPSSTLPTHTHAARDACQLARSPQDAFDGGESSRIEDDIGDAGENDPGGQDDASLIHCRSQLR